MRILHITAAYKPAVIYGGPTMSVSTLCEELVKAGEVIEVYATTANGTTELPVIAGQKTMVDGVPVTYFKRITKDHTHFSPALLTSLWRNVKTFDAVHIHAWWNLVSVLSCAVALLRRVPVVVSPRGMLSSYSFKNKHIGAKQLLHNLLGKALLKKAHIHTTSVYEQQAIAKIIHPVIVVNIPNFVMLGEANGAYRPDIAPVVKLLFFSRIEEKKGLDILLDALPFIRSPFELTIAGNGDPAYIDQLMLKTAQPALVDKVFWKGFHNETKFKLLAQHHLMILPSYDENFGNVVIEALSVGTAVLVSEQVGLAAYVAENNLGWICQTDPQSIAAHIDEIYTTQQQTFKQISQLAPGLVKTDFTGHLLTRRYIAFYQQIITQ